MPAHISGIESGEHVRAEPAAVEVEAEVLTHIGARRFDRNLAGEIDIIACDGDEIVFVEVRARSKGWMMPPECTVGPEKLKKLKRAARIWTESRNYTGFWRIDLIAVTLDEDKIFSLEHIKEITEGIR